MDFLTELDNILAENYVHPQFNYAKLCELLQLSRSQVYRKFQQYELGSPSTYIRQYRLEKGKGFLLNTKLTVSEISFKIGYSAPNQFTNIFSATFNISPKEFRSITKK